MKTSIWTLINELAVLICQRRGNTHLAFVACSPSPCCEKVKMITCIKDVLLCIEPHPEADIPLHPPSFLDNTSYFILLLSIYFFHVMSTPPLSTTPMNNSDVIQQVHLLRRDIEDIQHSLRKVTGTLNTLAEHLPSTYTTELKELQSSWSGICKVGMDPSYE